MIGQVSVFISTFMNKWAVAPWMKILYISGGTCILAYLGLILSLRLGQTRLMFFPSSVLENTPSDIHLPYEDLWIRVKQEKLNAWWIPSAQPKRPVLIYLHGNGSNLGDLSKKLFLLHQLGFSVLAIDYRGYGRSTGGFPSEMSVYEDAEAAWNYLVLQKKVLPKDIFLLGHSLGGAIAIELASRHPDVAGVIVEGTFTSMRKMVDYSFQIPFVPIDWILTQHFDSIAKVRSLKVPLLFIHGTQDTVVPSHMSQELYDVASPPKFLLLIPDAGHNNLATDGGEQYLKTISEFIETRD